jgi:hypothetical protein
MKKLFKNRDKELTPEQNRELLESTGVRVNTGYKKPSKFNQFSDYAQRVTEQRGKTVPGPSGPLATPPPSDGSVSNPYANQQLGYNKDAMSNGRGVYDKYGSYNGGGSSGRYGDSSNGYGGGSGGANYGAYDRPAAPRSSSASPYAAAENSYTSRFESAPALTRIDTSMTEQARAELFKGARETPTDATGGSAARDVGMPVDELLEMPSELDKRNPNPPPGFAGAEQTQLDSEDEEVESIKGQIKFVKHESVASTRNALRMAAEAEESGRNTLGMLGSQGERLANTERSLALAENQNQIAEEKARELKTLNRSIFAPHISNPFNSKRRLQEEEARIKQQYQQEQFSRENRRQIAFDSSQRVMNGLTSSGSETAMKYRKKPSDEERGKYQFEADSEDEDLENEIDANLDGISAAASRLNKLALATNEEVTRQNERLDNIAEQTDILDVNVHLNTSRLANIR